MTEQLIEKRCIPCEGGVAALDKETANKLLSQLTDWTCNEDASLITRKYAFNNFSRTMQFVNAVAWVANREGHHPDMEVGYNYCTIHFTTHAANGLTENDFICAAKVDNLFNM